MTEHRPTVAVDFDGVIHSYTSSWVSAHHIPDPPVEGAIEWLASILDEFNVVIFTTRASDPKGTAAVRRYLFQEGLSRAHEVGITDSKPPALLYIDDRGWRFNGPGTFPHSDQIHRARPWNKLVRPEDAGEGDGILHMDIAELRRLGYVQEVNRRFFHPLGLALEVTIGEDGRETLSGVWDCRSDPEGIVFDEAALQTEESVERALRISEELERRRAALGFSVQPIQLEENPPMEEGVVLGASAEALDLLRQGVEAFRLTREYLGESVLPELPGWAWADWNERAKALLGGE